MWLLFLQAFWFIAPAYAANAFPPLVKGRRPLDLGRNIGKKRILGDGKTIKGTIAGVIFGMFIGFIQILGQNSIPPELSLTVMTFPLVFLLSAGALFGDIVGSFIKRRLGMPRGFPAPVLDQLDFLAFAVIFSALVIALNTHYIIILVILTPIIHWIANLIGYFAKVKKTPW
ncbi:MAG: CDP-2,3-bis-(O-geranylgeranyl)-sn-glycerol synthase [Candidatus Aenigmarchaeota archaeon]|nr:CDP-2,3-bis-(O-geranylgeranyl)-sn-glycerol synthase [Candidatus Aenigmarchaeota archaeon]